MSGAQSVLSITRHLSVNRQIVKVMELGLLIREIRKGRKATLTAFGELIGVRHNTVSQYETGKARPSPPVLFRIWDLASTPRQRALIRKALGPVGDRLLTPPEERVRERQADEALRRFEGIADQGDAAVQTFQELAIELIRSGDIPTWLLAQIRLWLDLKDDLEARKQFEKMFNAQARAMATLKEVRQLQKGRD